MVTCSFEALHVSNISYIYVIISETRPCYVTQTDLKLTVTVPCTSASLLLRLEMCGTVPGYKLLLDVA